MNDISELCKVLYNPLRLQMLLSVCASKDGMNVGVLSDRMERSGLGVSAVSQYLKQLERIGVIRRVRAGRYVNYVFDARMATPGVRKAVVAIIKVSARRTPVALADAFGVLMNPFRARVVAAVTHAGSISADEICRKTLHQSRHLKRDLKAAIDAGILNCESSDALNAIYSYRNPADDTVRLLISLIKQY